MREGWTNTGEIERELDDTRSRLDDTIGALQRKVAPGTMVDQAVEYFSEGGGMEFGRNLGRSMRDNPIPVALIGVGLGWLMLANSRQTNGGVQGWREGRRMRDDRFGGGPGPPTCMVATATSRRAWIGRKPRSPADAVRGGRA